jgi:hypothetical protein
MSVYDFLKANRGWGSEVTFSPEGSSITDSVPAKYGVIDTSVVLDGHEVGEANFTVKVSDLWPLIQKMGPDAKLTAGVNKSGVGKLFLVHELKGSLNIPCEHDFASSISVSPKGKGGGVLSPETVTALRTLVATVGKEDDNPSWGLSGVRLTPSYTASTNGHTISVIWQETKVPESVTIPTFVIKKMKGDTFEVEVGKSSVFFTTGPKSYWCRRIATPWPEETINEMIPKRRSLPDSVTIKIPPQFTESVEVASLIPQGAGTPTKLILAGDTLTLSHDNPKYLNSWKIPDVGANEMTLGISPQELIKCLKLLPPDCQGYLSLGGTREPIMVYTAGSTSIECLTMPVYTSS